MGSRSGRRRTRINVDVAPLECFGDIEGDIEWLVYRFRFTCHVYERGVNDATGMDIIQWGTHRHLI